MGTSGIGEFSIPSFSSRSCSCQVEVGLEDLVPSICCGDLQNSSLSLSLDSLQLQLQSPQLLRNRFSKYLQNNCPPLVGVSSLFLISSSRTVELVCSIEASVRFRPGDLIRRLFEHSLPTFLTGTSPDITLVTPTVARFLMNMVVMHSNAEKHIS